MRMDESERSARFLDLLRPIQRELEVYGRRLVWVYGDAEDALQNAASRAFQALDRYREGTNFRAWMFKILTNEIFALNRKRGRIASFKVPRQVFFVNQFPMTGSGKIQKYLLREEAERSSGAMLTA